ncbi:MAG: hypothetical protein B9S34_03565 [Opitutia bacterium Tous-C1TDCM]|nr:MAG: hypothetical protein B9S34_03565 [Opitutae bacterium Tous-C1TDCM]
MLVIYGLPFLFFVVAGVSGTIIERRHYRSIRDREAATADLPVVTLRTLDGTRPVADARLVTASVVISHDNFKRFLAQLRKIFGGSLRSYESLLDRARREAVLRLKAECPDAHIVMNLRLDTANIANTQGKKGIGAIEVVASGTAVRFAG